MKSAVTIIFAAILTVAAARASEAPLPLIQLDNVPLPDALRQVARQGKMDVILDPRVFEAPYRDIKVSVRWENVTAREGLIALVDNYDLAIVESAR